MPGPSLTTYEFALLVPLPPDGAWTKTSPSADDSLLIAVAMTTTIRALLFELLDVFGPLGECSPPKATGGS